jgi:hypothetical protein
MIWRGVVNVPGLVLLCAFQPTPESKAAQCDLLSARVHVGLPAPPSTLD